MSTFQVVLVPTILGVTLNELFPSLVKKFTRVLPLVGIVLTTLLCASPVGQVSEVLKCAPFPVNPSLPLSEPFFLAVAEAAVRAPPFLLSFEPFLLAVAGVEECAAPYLLLS